MRIVCPSCTAEYEVPASRMTAPRRVRCARCGGEWLASSETVEAPPAPPPADPEYEQDPPEEPPAVLPPVSAMDRLTAAAPRARPPAGLVAAWVVTFVVLAAVAGAAITWREPLVRIWPASGRILGSIDPRPAAPNTPKPSMAAQR